MTHSKPPQDATSVSLEQVIALNDARALRGSDEPDDMVLVPRGLLGAVGYLLKHPRSLEELEDCEVYRRFKRAQMQPAFCKGTFWECQGKGGIYMLLGEVKGSGNLRGQTFTVYMDMNGGAKYLRQSMEFTTRMTPLKDSDHVPL